MTDTTARRKNVPPCEQFAKFARAMIKKNLEFMEKTVRFIQTAQTKGQLTPEIWNQAARRLQKTLDEIPPKVSQLLNKLPPDQRKDILASWTESEAFEEDVAHGLVPKQVKMELAHLRQLAEELIPCPSETQLTLMQRNADFIDTIVEGGEKGRAILRPIGLPIAVQTARLRNCITVAALAGPHNKPNLRPVKRCCAIAKHDTKDDGDEAFDKLLKHSDTPLGLAKRKQELLYAVGILRNSREIIKAEEERRAETAKWEYDDEDVLSPSDIDDAAGLSEIEILSIIESEEPEFDGEFDLGQDIDGEGDSNDGDLREDIEFEKQRWLDRVPEAQRYRWDEVVGLFAELRVRRDRIAPLLNRLSAHP